MGPCLEQGGPGPRFQLKSSMGWIRIGSDPRCSDLDSLAFKWFWASAILGGPGFEG